MSDPAPATEVEGEARSSPAPDFQALMEDELDALLVAAIERLRREMQAAAPFMAGRVWPWLIERAHSPQPADYFRNPLGFPLLRLPWWLAKTLAAEPALPFHSDLVYSTINGYYFIRLLDNVMDGHATVETQLLPAAGFFHTQFQSMYQRYFPSEHPFWITFASAWFHAADVTVRDASLKDVDEAAFREIASQKVSAVKIPLAAVGHYHGNVERVEAWWRFADRLGGWHQMWNDVFDWNKDLTYGTRSYFLCEAERRKRAGESIAAWVVREGLAWGVALLHAWLDELKALAAPLDSPELAKYLALRDDRLAQQQRALSDDLQRLARLAQAFPNAT